MNQRLLFTDLDNTLFNWVDYFAPCFRAMLHALSQTADISEDALYDQFRSVYGRAESLEYTWSIQQLDFTRGMRADEVERLVHVGKVAFGRALRRRLAPYPGVPSTLRWLSEQGVRVIGVTNSFVGDGLYRLRTLGLEKFFWGMVGWDGQDTDSDLAEQRAARALKWQRMTTIQNVMSLPMTELKPNPAAYRVVLERLASMRDLQVWVVGDSLNKDLVPGHSLGALTGWARYGHDVDKANFDTLLRITHWSAEKISKAYDTMSFTPDFILDEFAALREIIPASQPELFP